MAGGRQPGGMLTGAILARARRVLGILLVAILLTAAVPPTNASTVSEPAALPPLGMDVASARDLQAAGAAPKYGSFWVGAWIAQHGWGGMDEALRTAKATGTTPVLYFWYWGDGITKACVEYGCDGKSRAQWYSFADTMGEHVRTIMGGAEVVIVLENEFNKNDIVGPYAPTFDAHLEAIALDLKQVPGVKIILGFGAWNEKAWTQFPRAAAQSDYIGFQMMRGSTRHTEAEYRGAASEVARFTTYIADTFHKPSFLYDLALSSYQGGTWERIQAETLQGVFDNLVTAGQTGLQGVVYRSLRDHYMDPSNYFGAAESHWGLRYGDGRPKPSWDVWLQEATSGASRAPNVPGSFEAESAIATAGGRQASTSASGGAVWNLWSNGELRFGLQADAAVAARITVQARGDLASGVAPRMEVRLGDVLLATRDVASPSLAPYVIEAQLPAGASTLRVVFTNDLRTATEDRNLVVDVVHVQLPPPNRAPVAAFAATGKDLDWSFDASASEDPDGEALTYAWRFGDGATAVGPTASRAYAAAGTYVVTLTVSDGRLETSTDRTVVATRPNEAPTAAFTVAGKDLAWSFNGSASRDPDGDGLAYAWSFGDGGTATGPTASRTYAAAGTYLVTLTVSDGRLETSTERTVVATRPNQAPSAAFALAGKELVWTFDASASRDPDGDALAYAWDFGDGTRAAGLRVTKEYARAGDWRVTLTVTDSAGATGASAQTVKATLPPFTALFSGVKGNEWWVQVDVSASRSIAGVCASVNGGTCQPLKLQSWGSWAASFRVPAGSQVVFRANATTGETVSSGAYLWPSGTPVPTVTFTPHDGNAWWVQTKVNASAPVKSVCATVNGGKCQPLTLRSWGSWAASIHAKTGSQVVFYATFDDSYVVKSATYTWPVK